MQARLKFPIDYPYSPPAFRFLTKMWHPNIYETGDVCISILHPPVDDPQSGELPSERWNPTQNVSLWRRGLVRDLPAGNPGPPYTCMVGVCVGLQRCGVSVDSQHPRPAPRHLWIGRLMPCMPPGPHPGYRHWALLLGYPGLQPRLDVRATILLSVISLLNEPNTFSPANVDASVMYRKWKESKGKDREYTDIIR
ncbi:hypothetical protein P7K49_032678 [Saguinus oedipus]|uniref:UBC core domain-containing protein n=1 Tax=Saguinus oedipus TaxID=9490 RepID=A0ABQ9TPT3_SAGOE|nr:hypothetical protein P7K49_032678 [Saguinus oedipus]